ncbi:hypothetical protein EG68_07961 [Paragonimus skrjabini miyazakii]|uniref:Aminomethyltransferase folate-binding domain-containing protein n=1 Tax=Paragonimus skrjabini miyazakii TaxID=59628 RepID=A0A8S9YKF5_9TREM|nr:hypothetical protein EG68_07961 [Paragonimus skrjabini miyazakii]
MLSLLWMTFRVVARFCLSSLTSRRMLSIGRLGHKCLLCVRGTSAADFLQGLVTNDIFSIARPNCFMYSLILNTKGRILADTFVYNLQNESVDDVGYLLEVDKRYANQLYAYFSKYNLRKKVALSLEDNLSVWVAMASASSEPLIDFKAWLPVTQPDTGESALNRNLFFYAPDPRGVPGWSGRVLIRSGIQANDIFTAASPSPLSVNSYNMARWRLGLPEGPEELISGETLPLEANADLSGGVDFSKGCYVGQELTARTRFTGVVRRRFAPVQLEPLDSSVPEELVSGCHFLNAPIYMCSVANQAQRSPKVKPSGWLRAFCSNYPTSPEASFCGIALLRLTDATSSTGARLVAELPMDSSNEAHKLLVTPYAPSWWPDEVAVRLPRLKH